MEEADKRIRNRKKERSEISRSAMRLIALDRKRRSGPSGRRDYGMSSFQTAAWPSGQHGSFIQAFVYAAALNTRLRGGKSAAQPAT